VPLVNLIRTIGNCTPRVKRQKPFGLTMATAS